MPPEPDLSPSALEARIARLERTRVTPSEYRCQGKAIEDLKTKIERLCEEDRSLAQTSGGLHLKIAAIESDLSAMKDITRSLNGLVYDMKEKQDRDKAEKLNVMPICEESEDRKIGRPSLYKHDPTGKPVCPKCEKSFSKTNIAKHIATLHPDVSKELHTVPIKSTLKAAGTEIDDTLAYLENKTKELLCDDYRAWEAEALNKVQWRKPVAEGTLEKLANPPTLTPCEGCKKFMNKFCCNMREMYNAQKISLTKTIGDRLEDIELEVKKMARSNENPENPENPGNLTPAVWDTINAQSEEIVMFRREFRDANADFRKFRSDVEVKLKEMKKALSENRSFEVQVIRKLNRIECNVDPVAVADKVATMLACLPEEKRNVEGCMNLKVIAAEKGRSPGEEEKLGELREMVRNPDLGKEMAAEEKLKEIQGFIGEPMQPSQEEMYNIEQMRAGHATPKPKPPPRKRKCWHKKY